jgi:dihydrofolate synthase/folylpolyglutamate synthase
VDPLQYLFSLEKLGIKFGLDNIRSLCAALGSPEQSFRSLLIAGTNGKGSVTAMVERALRASGLRTARYTSPHLIRLEERFVVEGEAIETAAMRDAAGQVQRTADRLVRDGQLPAQPTFFEVTTALAFELFRRRNAEIAVLEVGLGGRFDATNVVTPIATAITSIDLDHQALLGSRLADIAFEKAGIVKPGVPLVLGETKPEAVDVIGRVCRERGAPLIHAASGVQMRSRFEADGRLTLGLTTPRRQYGTIALSLKGRHQATNALTAVRMLEELGTIPEAAIVAGISDVRWPGRLDLVDAGAGRSVLLDSAHNPAGAAALASYLSEAHHERLPIVFAAMHDKDAEAMVLTLRPRASAFVLTAPHTDRATTPQELAMVAARSAPGVPVFTTPNAEAALTRAWQLGPTVCATGSIFLIGEILACYSSSIAHQYDRC